jgi:hypothetical protein
MLTDSELSKIKLKVISILWGLGFIPTTLIIVYFVGAGPLTSFITFDSFLFGILISPVWIIWIVELILTAALIYQAEKDIYVVRPVLIIWFGFNVLENFVDIFHFSNIHMKFEEIAFCIIYAYGIFLSCRISRSLYAKI